MSSTWKNRMVGTADVDPRSIELNADNWRRHPTEQRRALEGALAEIGWIQTVVVNKRTGRLIDGHLRVMAAIDNGEATVPVNYVDLSDDEERLALATFDSISALATKDEGALASLLASIVAEDEGLDAFLYTLAHQDDFDDGFDAPVVPPESPREREPGGDALPPAPPAPENNDGTGRQIILNVTETQRDMIRSAMAHAAGGELSPAEALFLICRDYLDREEGLT